MEKLEHVWVPVLPSTEDKYLIKEENTGMETLANFSATDRLENGNTFHYHVHPSNHATQD